MNFPELHILEQELKSASPLDVPSSVREILDRSELQKAVKPVQTAATLGAPVHNRLEPVKISVQWDCRFPKKVLHFLLMPAMIFPVCAAG